MAADLLAFLSGARAHANPPRGPRPLPPVITRLLAMTATERHAFQYDGLAMLCLWMRGWMMREVGYEEEGTGSWTEQNMATAIRLVGAVLRDPATDPTAQVTLFRAATAPLSRLPGGDWRVLPGRVWRTGRRPIQSWTHSLASAREFARAPSAARSMELASQQYGEKIAQFIVEAQVDEARVVFRYRDLERGLLALHAHTRKFVKPSQLESLRTVIAIAYRTVKAKESQDEVVVDLPRGATLLTAVHPAIDPA